MSDKRIVTKYVIIALMSIFIMALWFYMHIYLLGEKPYEMYIDEYGVGYDSYSLLKYGVDRWLMKNPVYLNNYDSGSSIAYAVLCMLSIAVFGNTSTFTIRFPAAMVSLVSMIWICLISRKIKKGYFPFIALILFNIFPYFTMQSRVALDCNLMMSAMLMVIYVIGRAFEKDDVRGWLIAGIATGIALYTYILSWIVVPVMLLLVMAYGLAIKKLSVKKVLVFGVACGILALPLILVAIVNLFKLDSINMGIITIPRLINDRTTEFKFGNVIDSLKCFFSTLFYGDGMILNAIKPFYTVFTVSIPFFVLGLVVSVYKCFVSVKEKKFDINVIITALFIAELILGIALSDRGEIIGGDGINVYRINGVYGAVLLYIYMGIVGIYDFTAGILKKYSKKIIMLVGVTYFVVLTVMYGNNFYKWQKFYYEMKVPGQYCFAAQLDEVVEHFGEEFYQRNVHLDANYTQMLLATHISPYDFNAPALEKEMINIKSWKNFTFNVQGEFGVIDDNALYVVYKLHNEYIDYFRMFGLMEYETEEYICFYN